MLASTALVLLMTIPGLALFYAGMVRKKNVLATLMQSFAITCIVTIVWTVAGYSLAFTNGNAYVGDLSRFMLNGIADHITKATTPGVHPGVRHQGRAPHGHDHPRDRLHDVPDDLRDHHAGADPGAFADRMKFSALCIFMTLWSLLVYSPIAHWVWAPTGWAGMNGELDFAGGTVVHINAGIAGLVCALVLGKRVGYGTDNMAPYNLALRGDRRLAAVGGLVRLQRRVRGGGRTGAPAWRWR